MWLHHSEVNELGLGFREDGLQRGSMQSVLILIIRIRLTLDLKLVLPIIVVELLKACCAPQGGSVRIKKRSRVVNRNSEAVINTLDGRHYNCIRTLNELMGLHLNQVSNTSKNVTTLLGNPNTKP